MHAQDRLPAQHLGPIDHDRAIEATGPQQRRIERFGPIGRGHQDHAAVGIEAIHLDEEGVECLFAFVVSAHGAVAAGLAHGVEFVDEDDAGSAGIGLGEQIAHPTRPDADEHLDEVRPAHAEERHVGLARHRAGQQGLSRARRTDEQHALGNATAEGLILLGRLEKVDDFAKFGDGFVDAGDVDEGGFVVAIFVELVFAAAERKRRTPARHPPKHQEPEAEHQTEHQQQGEERPDRLHGAVFLRADKVGTDAFLESPKEEAVVGQADGDPKRSRFRRLRRVLRGFGNAVRGHDVAANVAEPVLGNSNVLQSNGRIVDLENLRELTIREREPARLAPASPAESREQRHDDDDRQRRNDPRSRTTFLAFFLHRSNSEAPVSS